MPNWVKQCKEDDKYTKEMIQRRNRERKKYYNKTSYARRGHSSWYEYEDKLVLAHVLTDSELAQLIHRSVQAIQQRRWKLKKARTNE